MGPEAIKEELQKYVNLYPYIKKTMKIIML